VILTAEEKHCCQCEILKPLSAFSKNKRTKDGYKYSCKQCISQEYFANREAEILKRKQHYQENKEQYIARAKVWKKENPEKVRLDRKQWNDKNKPLKAFYTSSRRSYTKRATPPWANLNKIQEIFEQASQQTQETGIVYSVDHIIPLRGKLVSGLHVEHNLRVIPKLENCRKGNRYDQT
jgi:hypothetical protein